MLEIRINTLRMMEFLSASLMRCLCTAPCQAETGAGEGNYPPGFSRPPHGTFEASATYSSMVAEVNKKPKASPSTLPRVISHRVAEFKPPGRENFVSIVVRDICLFI